MKRYVLVMVALAGTPAMADNLYRAGNWVALASDRHAEHVGDSLTIPCLGKRQRHQQCRRGDR